MLLSREKAGWADKRAGYDQGQQASSYWDAFSWTDHLSFSSKALEVSAFKLSISNCIYKSQLRDPAPFPALPCMHPPWLYRKGEREQFSPRLVNNWLKNSSKRRRWSDRGKLAFRQRLLSYQIKRRRFFKLAPTSPAEGEWNYHDFPFFPSIPQGGEYNSSYPVLGVPCKPELGSASEG